MSKKIPLVTAIVCVAIVGGLAALAIPTLVSVWTAVVPPAAAATPESTPTASTKPSPSPTIGVTETPLSTVAGCGDVAMITTPWHDSSTNDPVKLSGELVDNGPTGLASGKTRLNADGEIESYVVAEGDTSIGIAERFCVDWVTVMVFNHRWPPQPAIQPGEVLVLRPDPTAPWSPGN